MIKICCDSCGAILEKPGALMFSPPDKNNLTKKYHICVNCYDEPVNEQIAVTDAVKPILKDFFEFLGFREYLNCDPTKVNDIINDFIAPYKEEDETV